MNLHAFAKHGMDAQHAVDAAASGANGAQDQPTPAMISTWMNKASLMDSSARTLRVSVINVYPGSKLAKLALESMTANAALLAELRDLSTAKERSAR
jgi:hypothetical protein